MLGYMALPGVKGFNIVEKTSGQKPCKIANTVKYDDDGVLVSLILEKYKDHPVFFP